MDIYVAHTFGRRPDLDESERDAMLVEHITEGWGDIIISRHTELDDAKTAAVNAFLAEPVKQNSSWIKEVRLWHPARDPAHADRLVLWSLLPAAAPSMTDENRKFYPQMRETSYWVEEIHVDEDPIMPAWPSLGPGSPAEVAARLRKILHDFNNSHVPDEQPAAALLKLTEELEGGK